MPDTAIHIAGEELLLCPEKAIFWPRHQLLLVSDAHLGKVAHFRKNGMAIPAQAALSNFELLKNLCARLPIFQIIFLGDLFHSVENIDLELFAQWHRAHSHIALKLVVGNHDIIQRQKLEQSGLEIVGHIHSMSPFVLSHKPLDTSPSGHYNLCGHIHPGIKMRLKSINYVKLPVFYFSHKVGILPAFGEFTGLHTIEPQEGDQVYAIAQHQIIQVQ